MRYRLDFDIV